MSLVLQIFDQKVKHLKNYELMVAQDKKFTINLVWNMKVCAIPRGGFKNAIPSKHRHQMLYSFSLFDHMYVHMYVCMYVCMCVYLLYISHGKIYVRK